LRPGRPVRPLGRGAGRGRLGTLPPRGPQAEALPRPRHQLQPRHGLHLAHHPGQGPAGPGLRGAAAAGG
ncbi:unnamed protein product, partial [Heterosigma akashiwo]